MKSHAEVLLELAKELQVAARNSSIMCSCSGRLRWNHCRAKAYAQARAVYEAWRVHQKLHGGYVPYVRMVSAAMMVWEDYGACEEP